MSGKKTSWEADFCGEGKTKLLYVRGNLSVALFCKRSMFVKTFVLSGCVKQCAGTKHTLQTKPNTCSRIWPCNVLFTVRFMDFTMAPLSHHNVSRPKFL